MSHARFAPVTASLLARKGNAMPSMMTPAAILPPFLPAAVEPAPQRPPAHDPLLASEHDQDAQPHDPARSKKLYIPMSHREHERLAIAAVKTGLTRHQLVRDALEMYFEQLSADMGDDCACITGGFASRSGCCMS
jgi:hypothetical protein